ncbi:nitroreductase/quinone reductase family protein [Streptomyces sp. NPDC059866]|uniref:nitroreductase/quinone reductase family protein n=1 Tax=Streptomyces sp. NPDC059866 TaxID=3346978 RepID=UPI003646526A
MSRPDRKPATDSTRPPSMKFFRAANKVVRPLLASRFHRPLSGRLMLLTYNGRRTGREYTVPIGYSDWDPGTVLAMSSQLSWIPSMRGDPTVTLRIRGRDHQAVPTVIEDEQGITDTLREFARRNGPKAAKGLMLGFPGDRQPTEEELHTAAGKARLVRFHLTS